MKHYLWRCALAAVLAAGGIKVSAQEKIEADVCVYGATPAGVMAAIECASRGKSVVLLSTDSHIGGMTASGLGATDINNRNAIGGLAREFYKRMYTHYARPAAWKNQTWDEFAILGKGRFFGGKSDSLKMMWVFEPHVAKQIFADMLGEAKVKVHYNARLDLDKPVVRQKGAIRSIVTEAGDTYAAKMFIDATYEGDLMARAGVSYFVGRESNATYNETKNGVLPGSIFGVGEQAVDPYIKEGDPASGLLPYIEPRLPGAAGSGDKRGQAYCYRFTLTTDPANKLPFVKPDGYDPMWFEFMGRKIALKPSITMESILTITPLPNQKTDINHADFVGAAYDWPEGNYATRDKIARMHKKYVLGLLWFLVTDKRVPARIKNEISRYGFPKDEFTDNGHFPHQIYVREARRMVSGFVMTEHHYYGRETAGQSVGLGTYWLDSHVVSRYVDNEGKLRNEGTFWENKSQTYPIDYRAIVPREKECSNLLVPVCLSASHAAYGSIRMEPQYMVLGQSAAVAACLSIDRKCALQRLPYNELKKALQQRQQILFKEETMAKK